MRKLCLVTYTRSNEVFPMELNSISNAFYEKYKNDFKVVVCCETHFEIVEKSYTIELFEITGTKYRRLISLLEKDDSNYYLSIDNDITGNIAELLDFVEVMIHGDYEIGWGRISTKRQKNFISNMVAVDKLLSHNIIRPLLWKAGVGISIPGQIFCIRGESFKGRLIQLDTFLDDLALGLYVNITKNKKKVISNILGQEQSNSCFNDLCKQRIRWAIGYSAIFKAVKDKKKYKSKVIIHGLSYHILWLLNWVIIILLGIIYLPLSILYVLLISFLIAKNDLNMVVYSLVYQFVFPIFHIRWGVTFINEMLKGD